MKKTTFFSVLVIILGLAVQLFFILNYQMNGEKQISYLRILKVDSNGRETFNWLGLISPIQSEGQKIGRDTVSFTKKVIYPFAPRFTIIPPSDSTAEMRVANEIAQVISDTLNKIRFNLKLDYDNQALAVRESAKPQTRKLADPLVQISLFGTSSPEAHKYGLKESIMPGNFEPENSMLANHRLLRTGRMLQGRLLDMGINPDWTNYASDEIQLKDTNEVAAVMANPSILDTLRYVQADVVITTEKLEITPATTPIALPLWWLGITWLLTYLFKKRKGTGASKWDWSWLGNLGMILIAIAFVLFLIGALNLIPWELLMKLFEGLVWIIAGILLFLGLSVVMYAIYLLLQVTMEQWMNFFRAIWKAFLNFLLFIWNSLVRFVGMLYLWIILFILWIIDRWRDLRAWWSRRCTCCKVLMIILLVENILLLFYFIL